MPTTRTPVRRAAMAGLTAGAAALALTVPGTAVAASGHRPAPKVRSAVDVAGTSPYLGRQCNVATPYYTQPGGKEGEPTIAVDPRRPRHRIAAWMDATRATVDVAYSTDGGRSWRTSAPRGIDDCTGDSSQAWEASGDVWVSFGPDGRAYMSTLTWAHFVTPPATGYVSVVHVQTSTDGGRTWSAPVFLDGRHSVSDKPMVLADPRHRGVAYEIWRNQSFGMPVGARGATELLFSRTDDGGRTWSAPRHIADGSDSDFFGSPQVSVLKNKTLVATTSLGNASGGVDLLAYRSGDGGRTWSGPVVIRSTTDGALAPVCGQGVAGADGGSSAGQQTVLGGRTVALVAIDGAAAAAGRGALVLSTSSDGGRTWHNRTVVRRDRPVLLASVAAGRGHALGMVFDEIDTAGVTCAPDTVPTRTRLLVSHDGGRSWGRAVTIGAPWWDLASGARGTGGFSGYFVGDYQSLAAVPAGFTTATVQGRALVAGGPAVTGDTGTVVATVRR